jgi:tetratricopeptide (TPR) repeat protein
MAFNKAKAIQEAHKYIGQGKISRAIKQYQWTLERDPSDLALLNIIGDLYIQENNPSEALKYFYRLAEAYAHEGYKLKAIAIYKKIAKLDRNSPEPLLRLAELHASQGFAREAREQYSSAFEFFERAGQMGKALDILRKLCQLDPKSPALRLDLAKFADRAGEVKEATAAYLEAARLADQAGDTPTAEIALSKAAELAPENTDLHLYRARRALAAGRLEEVKSIVESVPQLQGDPQAQRLLLDSCLATGDLQGAKGLLLNVFRANPYDFSPLAAFSSKCITGQEFETALEILKEAAPILIARRETGPLMGVLHELWKSARERIEVLEFVYQVAEKAADEATIPDVLEALGNLYVQREEFEKAEQAYARLVAREPENETYKALLKQVLAKQRKDYVPLSETPLVGDDMALEEDANSFHGGIAFGAPADSAQAAGTLPRIHSAQGNHDAAQRYEEEVQKLSGIAVRPEADPPSLPTVKPGMQASEGNAPAHAAVEIALPPSGGDLETLSAGPELPPPQEIHLDFQTGQSDDGSSPNAGSSNNGHSSGKTPDQQAQPTSGEGPSFNYEESHEEIEFYLRHGFYDEAERAVSELEAKFPEEARVAEFRQRLAEISPATIAVAPQAASVVETEETESSEWELPTSFTEVPHSGHAGDQIAVAGNTPSDVPGSEFAAIGTGQDPATVAPSSQQSIRQVTPQYAADASAELGSLLEELEDSDGNAYQEADDEETHYNLGVAFREMGLLDEAIGEFQKVVRGGNSGQFGPLFLQGCTLLASCFMEKEMPAIAAKWYMRALEAPGLDHEGALALCYDLGIAFEKAGNTAAALEKFTEVYSQNIDYRDVAEKIRLLRQSAH